MSNKDLLEELKKEIKTLKLQVNYLKKMICLDSPTCRKAKKPCDCDEFMRGIMQQIDDSKKH
jgi:hypothetical protein